MKIEKYIQELLFWHDCVIIPGFGGFVTSYVAAEINNTNHLFTPPSKKITFNKNLKNNDGLLANHIAVVENKSFYQALNLIEESVSSSLDILNKGKQINLKGIGKFYLNKENNLQFEPFGEINLLIDSFGLNEFHSPLIKREPLHKRIEKRFKDRPAIGSEKKSRLKKWAVTLAALPILAAMAWLPLKTDIFYDLSVNYSSLIPFSLITEPAFNPREENNSFNIVEVSDELDKTIISTEKNNIPEESHASVTDELLEEPTINLEAKVANAVENIEAEDQSNFYVIAGCFGVIENAENMVSDLKSKGYNAKIVDKNKGLFRVCYKGFSTKDEAIDLLINVKNSENPAAWILFN